MGTHPGGVVDSPATADQPPVHLDLRECILIQRAGRWSCVRDHAEHDPALCQHPARFSVTALCDRYEAWYCRTCDHSWTEPRGDAPR